MVRDDGREAEAEAAAEEAAVAEEAAAEAAAEAEAEAEAQEILSRGCLPRKTTPAWRALAPALAPGHGMGGTTCPSYRTLW